MTRYKATVAGLGVTLNVLPWPEEAGRFRTFICNAPDGILGLDVETTAIEDSPGAPQFDPNAKLRMVQFGSFDAAWCLDPHDEFWRREIEWALFDTATRFVTHTNYDPLWVQREFGIDLGAEARSIDTLVMACLLFPGYGDRGLKGLSERFIDAGLVEAETALIARFKDLAPTGQRVGKKLKAWGFTNCPLDDKVFATYAGLDAVYVRWLLDELAALLAGRTRGAVAQRALSRREQHIARLANAMQWRGLRVDSERSKAVLNEVERNYAAAEAFINDEMGMAGKSPKRADWLAQRGVVFDKYTQAGNPVLDKDTIPELLDYYRDEDVEPEVIKALEAMATLSGTSNLRTNFRTIVESSRFDGFVHPKINTQAAVTGRMCLPDAHRLLTRRGILPISDVIVGDETLDASGTWVRVGAIHCYTDQETVLRQHRHGAIEATAEHRWLVSSPEKPEPWLEALTGGRRKIHLALGEPFDFKVRTLPIADDKTQFAALVGLLVSDGRCAQVDNEMRSYVYQTEAKFYSECLRAIPAEALQYDRITNNADHHELRINTRWLRPRLEEAGLRADPLLRTSESLWSWVLGLSLDELHAFFTAIWLADGTTAHPNNRSIASDSEVLRRVLQYTGYRLGCQSRITNDGIGGWATKDRLGVKFIVAPIWTRFLVESKSRSDVWCVTTHTGTFTAWSDRPYLTGNSVVVPAMQTFKKDDKRLRGCFKAREGHVLVGADYDSQEIRLALAFSGDPALRRVIEEGVSQHVITAKMIFGSAFEGKEESPRLYLQAKILNFAQQYGAGPKTIARQLKISYAEARALWLAWRAAYRTLVEWTDRMSTLPVVVNPWGRRIPRDPWRHYANGNYLIQSSGRDLLGDALAALDDEGWGSALWLPIHDEIILEVPEVEADSAVKALEACMQAEVRGVPFTATATVLGERWSGEAV